MISRFHRKAMSGIELVLIILMTFSISYLIYTEDHPMLPVVKAQSTLSTPSACCEKTTSGAYCINTASANCDANFKSSPTSCETTSYCRLGTCYDSEEGICMENTPQRVCQENSGTWDARAVSDVPQCQLGCCVIADQAAFVPLVRCKRLSTLFGVEIDYRKDITSELNCIATAQSQDTGACVYEQDFERTCKFTTRKDCGATQTVEAINGTNISLSSDKKFYKDYLCSAEELNTACAKQAGTTCYQGDVYWTDSCGNRENVYSSDKVRSWNSGRVLGADSICNKNDGSNKNCGNCDYLLGTRCEAWQSILGIGKPDGSDYFCQRTECVDRTGNQRKNGESWCVYDSKVGNGTDLVGSRYYRELCVDGEVHVEPCADFRNQICIQDSVETEDGQYGFAACRVNRWQDCLAQTKESDCTNIDKRECFWVPSVVGMVIGGGAEKSGQVFSNPTVGDTQTFSNPSSGQTFSNGAATGAAITGYATSDTDTEQTSKTNRPNGICVPSFSPGLKFWQEGDASSVCAQASAKCVVGFEKGLLGSEKCVENCECLEDGWANDANKVCTALGDCGGYINYQGKYTEDGYTWTVNKKEKKFAPNVVNKLSSGFTGKVVSVGYDMFALVSGNPYYDSVSGKTYESYDTFVAANSQAKSDSSSGSASNMIAGAGTLLTGVQLAQSVQKNLLDTPALAQTPAGAKTPVQGVVEKGLLGETLKTGSVSGPSMYTGFDKLYGGGTNANVLEISTKDVYIGDNLYKGQQYMSTTTGDYAKVVIGDGKEVIAKWDNSLNSGAGGWAAIAGSTPTYDQSFLAQMFKLPAGGPASALVSGLQWAGVAAGIGYVVGSLFGMSSGNTMALTLALGGGAFVYETMSTYKPIVDAMAKQFGASSGLVTAGIGLGVAALIFIAMYKTESTQVVTFQCSPWQAPSGGNDCEICNDQSLPCSEYRCKSLGQNCELVNSGTEQEKCVNVNPYDVDAPFITPNKDKLTNGYSYANVKSSPPGPGFTINKDAGTCVRAFEKLQFGVDTDEPAQCKIDFVHTTKFDDMATWLGNSNLYLYNHSEQLILPNTKDLVNSSITLQNGKEMTLYIRCKDKNGNANEAEYAVRFCVDPTPDNTAPEIKMTSIQNEGCVAANTDSANAEFYVSEPAQCRWSFEDQSYDVMQNQMQCSDQLYQINALDLFTCRANLTGVSRDLTTYYIRCKDQPNAPDNDRNKNEQSYVFKLKGSTNLKMTNLAPNGTVFGAVNPAPVTLKAETLFGCNNGNAICYYSTTGNDNDYVMFYDTGKADGIHTQRQDLSAGSYTYYIKCVDSGGNVAINTTRFTLEIDTNAPVIARAYEEDNMLKIVTVRNSECSYSFNNCDFTFQEGTEMPYANSSVHVAEWNKDKTYYIKCRDEFKNEDADCSMVVRPSTKLF